PGSALAAHDCPGTSAGRGFRGTHAVTATARPEGSRADRRRHHSADAVDVVGVRVSAPAVERSARARDLRTRLDAGERAGVTGGTAAIVAAVIWPGVAVPRPRE